MSKEPILDNDTKQFLVCAFFLAFLLWFSFVSVKFIQTYRENNCFEKTQDERCFVE